VACKSSKVFCSSLAPHLPPSPLSLVIPSYYLSRLSSLNATYIESPKLGCPVPLVLEVVTARLFATWFVSMTHAMEMKVPLQILF
jgi:hypothetical protein